MNSLEFFSGSKTFSAVANDFGYKTLTVDKYVESDLKVGIEDITCELILEKLGTPDVIWASPVCSAWSKTGWFHYWDTSVYKRTGRFVTDHPYAIESVEMVRKTIEIFSWFPGVVFFMENPEGMLAKHPVINSFIRYGFNDVKRHTVTYCRYGDTIMKPTHIWTNSKTWKPRRRCKNGDGCHIDAPRCSQKGLRSKSDAYERSKVPYELCCEIFDSLKTKTQG